VFRVAAIAVIALVVGGVAVAADGAEAAPAASATPVASAKPLREIGHVRARSAYCSAFELHFNGAARSLLAHDASIGLIDHTLDDVTLSFNELAGDMHRYDLRLRLSAYVHAILRDIPAGQAEVNALRLASALTADQQVARRTHDLAAAMQRGLDRQRQIATDASGVVQALQEFDQERAFSSASYPLPGTYDPESAAKPAAELDVKEYLRLRELEDRIGDAESAAADLAERIASGC
jgi:hypothetical protein